MPIFHFENKLSYFFFFNSQEIFLSSIYYVFLMKSMSKSIDLSFRFFVQQKKKKCLSKYTNKRSRKQCLDRLLLPYKQRNQLLPECRAINSKGFINFYFNVKQQYFMLSIPLHYIQNLPIVSKQYQQTQINVRNTPKIPKNNKEKEQQEQFYPQNHHIKKLGLKIKKKNPTSGGWTIKENTIYYKFLQQSSLAFASQKTRRQHKVFYKLSKKLKKRSPQQCRSHHQKFQIKYGDDIHKISEAVKQKIDKIERKKMEKESFQKVEERNEKNCERQFQVPVQTQQVESRQQKVQKYLVQQDWFEVGLGKSNGFIIKIQADKIESWI